MRRLTLLTISALLFFAACGDDGNKEEESEQDVAAATDTIAEGDMAPVTSLSFGESCAAPEECDSGVCHEFGNGGSLCTVACEGPDDCPDGSEGKKCNNKGVCKP